MRRTLAVVLLVAFALAVPASAGESPLQPLAAFGKHFDEGIAAFLSGKTLAEAFAPWLAKTSGSAGVQKVREELTSAKAASAKAVFLEFEFYLMKGETAVYYVRTDVWPDAAGPTFLKVEGRIQEGEPNVDSKPPAELTGPSQPLAKAAEATWKALAGEGWKSLPWTDRAKWEALVPESDLRQDGLKNIDKSQRNVAEVAKAVAAAQADSIRVRVDDLAFLVFDADKKLVGAIGGELKLPGEGDVEIELERFRPPPKEKEAPGSGDR